MSVGQGFRHSLAEGASTLWSLKRLHWCRSWSHAHCLTGGEQPPRPGGQDSLPSLSAAGLSLPSGLCPAAFSTGLPVTDRLSLEVVVSLTFSVLRKKSVSSLRSVILKAGSHYCCWRGLAGNRVKPSTHTGGKKWLKSLNTRR